MIAPSDLNPSDIDDNKLPALIEGYTSNNASTEDWVELLATIRDLGYHVGYKHGSEDERKSCPGLRQDYVDFPA